MITSSYNACDVILWVHCVIISSRRLRINFVSSSTRDLHVCTHRCAEQRESRWLSRRARVREGESATTNSRACNIVGPLFSHSDALTLSLSPRAPRLSSDETVIYTSEKRGNDESGDGSLASPFKSVLQALRAAGGQDPLPTIKVDARAEGDVSLPWGRK